MFVRENVLGIDVFSCLAGEPPNTSMEVFSISEFVFRNLKLSLGRKFLMVDLPLDDVRSGDPWTLTWLGLGNGEKFTPLGVGIGNGGMFIVTESSLDPSIAESDIFLINPSVPWFWTVDNSSTISLESPA